MHFFVRKWLYFDKKFINTDYGMVDLMFVHSFWPKAHNAYCLEKVLD